MSRQPPTTTPTPTPKQRRTQVRHAVNQHHQRRLDKGEIKISPSFYVPAARAAEIRRRLKLAVADMVAETTP